MVVMMVLVIMALVMMMTVILVCHVIMMIMTMMMMACPVIAQPATPLKLPKIPKSVKAYTGKGGASVRLWLQQFDEMCEPMG